MFAVTTQSYTVSRRMNRTLWGIYKSTRTAGRLAAQIPGAVIEAIGESTPWLLEREQRLLTQGWTGQFRYGRSCRQMPA